jgi:hypothetical protein
MGPNLAAIVVSMLESWGSPEAVITRSDGALVHSQGRTAENDRR